MTESEKKGFWQHGEFLYDLDHTGEQELIMVCMNSIPEWQTFTFFDVGANRGDWTGYLTENATRRYQGHLFEPSASLIERLKINVGHDENIVINHAALSNVGGPIQFRKYPWAEGVNSLVVDTTFWDYQLESEIEESYSLVGDEYCYENNIKHIDLLKIDVEGWEWNVLEGFQFMLTNHMIDVVQFEYGFLTADLHVSMKDFWKLFNHYGYEVGPLAKEGVQFRNFTYFDNSFRADANYVARLLT